MGMVWYDSNMFLLSMLSKKCLLPFENEKVGVLEYALQHGFCTQSFLS